MMIGCTQVYDDWQNTAPPDFRRKGVPFASKFNALVPKLFTLRLVSVDSVEISLKSMRGGVHNLPPAAPRQMCDFSACFRLTTASLGKT